MEKIINDIFTLFLFNILKLLCSNFLYIYLIFLHQRLYWMAWWGTLRATVYKFTQEFDLTFFYFKFIPIFYTLVLHILGKVLVKSPALDLGFRNTTHFVFSLIYNYNIYIKKRINADIVLDSNAYTWTTGSLAFIFIFQKVVFLDPSQ